MNKIKKGVAMCTLQTVMVAGSLFLFTGCEDSYKTKCEDKGGKVTTEHEKKKVTKKVNGKSKTSYKTVTERECKGKDGEELMEDED